MLSSLRPLTAGTVAVVGAGFIAVTPVAAPPPVDLHRAESAVRLAATTDWSKAFGDAQGEINALVDAWNAGTTAPLQQQIIANRLGYLRELPNLPAILGQMQANLHAAANAISGADTSTLDFQHQLVYAVLPLVQQNLSSIVKISDTGMQLLAFATSPLSGVLLGLAGPGLGATLVLGENLNSIGADLFSGTPNLARAISTLLNTPAGMTDAFLNGGETVDITNLVSTVGPLIGVEFPKEVRIELTLGGMLSPGGSMFNALGFKGRLDLFTGPLTIDLVNGNAVGPIGSLIHLGRAIAKAIGWDGTHSPLNSLAATTTTSAAAVPTSVAASLAAAPSESSTSASSGPGITQGTRTQEPSDVQQTIDAKDAQAPSEVVRGLHAAVKQVGADTVSADAPTAGAGGSGDGQKQSSHAGQKRASGEGQTQGKHRRVAAKNAASSAGAGD